VGLLPEAPWRRLGIKCPREVLMSWGPIIAIAIGVLELVREQLDD
jgi:hypothetical protein